MAHLDWVTASIPYVPHFMGKLPVHEAFMVALPAKPPGRYESGWLLENGATVFIPSEKNARQKILFQITGDALDMNRTLGVEDTKLLYWLMREKQAKFSRVDVAFDTKDSFSDPDHLLWAWDGNLAKTRIKAPARSYREGEHGITHYFGATDSQRILRTYNKAAELEQLWQTITRVELQSRKTMAQHLVHQIIENNNLDWTAAAAVKSLIDFPTVKWFQQLMASGGVKLEPLGRKATDWQKYIVNIIEPSYITHYRENEKGDRWFIRQSLERIHDKIKDIDKNLKAKADDT